MSPDDSLKPEDLVNSHGDYLLSFALSKLRNQELAKDLVQDTFVSALSNIETFEKRSKVRTWLTSILNRKIIDHWRKAETRYTDPASSFFDQGDKNHHWILDKAKGASLDNIEQQIEKAETIEQLNECIDALPEKWRAVIASKYLDEKESESICKDLELSSSNLWVIIHRAKLVLRDCLKSKK
jgi:RNA polymerase sigma-70 factor (ECF subfamily)